MGARSWSERRTQPPPSHLQNHVPHSPTAAPPSPGPPGPSPNKKHNKQKHYLPSPPSPSLDTSALFTPSTLNERQRLEAAVLRDRQVRLHSIQTDILLNLPPAIALPDGEDQPGGQPVKLLRLRDPDQESEIYRGYIRPPPNRTIPPPPYRATSGIVYKSLCSVVRTPESTSSSLVTRSKSATDNYRASYPQDQLVMAAGLQQTFTSQLRSLAAPNSEETSLPGYPDPPPRYSDVVGQDEFKPQSNGV